MPPASRASWPRGGTRPPGATRRGRPPLCGRRWPSGGDRLWAQRMLALYRAGRQAEALRAYQDLRRFLGEELGIEPTATLAKVETAILRHDPDLDWRPTDQAAPLS